MAISRHREFESRIIRVIDSDTVEAWVEVHASIAVRWKIRLQGIEGGELNTDEGQAGREALVEFIGGKCDQRIWFLTTDAKLDQFGRHIGDFQFEDGTQLCDELLRGAFHWPRSREGKQSQDFRVAIKHDLTEPPRV